MATENQSLSGTPPPRTDGIPPAEDDGSPAAPIPSLRPTSRDASGITASSTHLGQVNAARKGEGAPPRPQHSMSNAQPGALNPDILARLKAFSIARQKPPPNISHASTGDIRQAQPPPGPASPTPPGPGAGAGGGGPPAAGALAGRLPPMPRPSTKNWASSPSLSRGSPSGSPSPGPSPRPGGLAAKRMKPGLKLSDAAGPNGSSGDPQNNGGSNGTGESAFDKYSEYIDTKTGSLNFKNKAILHGGGIEFSSGHSFKISLDEVDRLEELGKGNYGSVYKVRHSRPHMRKPGMGLSGIISRPDDSDANATPGVPRDNLSGVVMALKEIRLELDESKFAQILMELDILHRCTSPFIIDFYGAFFQEGAVYMCVEYMDGGSIDRLYHNGIPEHILRKVTLSTVMGLKALKDDHNIIHRDVKPTNILINTKGQIKICDFGVSGNLVASIAKTNIGCQSYMAPERIAGGGVQQPGGGGGTYSVQSDVWSLGLAIIECALGRYPYPPETFNNIFSQLHAIVHGDPPTLPETGFSEEAHAFVAACLDKSPNKRPNYNLLLRHPWLAPLMEPPQPDGEGSDGPAQEKDLSSATEDKEVADWVKQRIHLRETGQLNESDKPALHKVALDAVSPDVVSPLLDDPNKTSEP